MGEKQTCGRIHSVDQICTWWIRVLILVLAVAAASAQEAESFESPIPVLISEPNSAYALAASPDNWSGSLPGKTSEKFKPGQRVVVFVTNLDLLPDEGANAFRVFAKDEYGKRYRFVVENISRLPRGNSVYAVILRIFDPNGYNGQPAETGDLTLSLSWRGNISNIVRLRLGTRVRADRSVDRSSASITQVPNAPTAGQMDSADRKRFMEQATFGPSTSLDSRIRRLGFRTWINEQFSVPYPTIPYPNFPQKPFDGLGSCAMIGTSPEADLCHRNHYWDYNNKKWIILDALYGEDQLRRRVSWALHQIWVVAHANINQQRGLQEYFEILDRNAFENYRTLMYQMTLSPAMGEYLDTVRSTRFNPNENYPRELLQLFTIGLYQLNQDGTLVRDVLGKPIPTYDQEKINQFTKVFTGWTQCNNGLLPQCSGAVPGIQNYVDPMMVSNPNNHDLTEKSLFSYPGAPNPTIAACSNCTTDAARVAYATESLNKTLDNIFNHPNVGPFIGKLLIQHLVMSDPSPAYVSRVAAAFNNNGAGVRGDMKAVIKAILLDPEARGSQKTDPTYGKLRDPFLHMMNLLRMFGAKAGTQTSSGVQATAPASCQGRSDGIFEWAMRESGQDILNPPSVFSYFPPDYVVPGTDILGPEFGLANTGSSFWRNNHVSFFAFGGTGFDPVTAGNPYPWVPCGTSIDHTEPIAWATADPTGNTLIEGLNWRMMHGTMSASMKTTIRNAINFNVDAWNKASQAIYLVASSSQYQIQR